MGGLGGMMKVCYSVLLEKPDGKRPIAKVDVHGRAWTRLMWLRIVACAGNEPFVSMNCTEFLH